MRLISVYIAVILVLASAAVAFSNDGTQSPFSLGAGARELSLAGANLAVADAATAPFWNPSRLATAERLSFGGFHARLYESDIRYNYLGLAVPTLDFGGFGVGVFWQSIDGIEKRDASNLLLGEIDDNQMDFCLAYGRSIAGYNLGFSGTIAYHSLDGYSATSSPGINLSLSRSYTSDAAWLDHVAVAISARNVIGEGIRLADETYRYPFAIDAGITCGVVPKTDLGHMISVSASIKKVDQGDTRLGAGIEYSMAELLHLRGGLRHDHFSVGAGLTYRSLSFDYAMIDRDLGLLHMFNVTSSFGKTKTDRLRARAEQRETEFKSLMEDRLTSRNRRMIADLTAEGEEKLDSGNFLEAINSLDRALFIARSIGADTVRIHGLAVDTRKKLSDFDLRARVEGYVDSARTKYAAGEYIAARYFSSLALSEDSSSAEAKALLSDSEEAVRQMAAREDMIREQLLKADSLLIGGRLKDAHSVINSLADYAPNNDEVRLALTRLQVEKWKETAYAAYSENDWQRAADATDSALTLFHCCQWCKDMLGRIRYEQGKLQHEQASIATEPAKPELSESQLQGIRITCEAAQKDFKEGKLPSAIAKWEDVLKVAPDYGSVRHYLIEAYKFVGVELYGKKKREDALEMWKKAARLDPDDQTLRQYIDRTENEIRKLRELSYDN